MKPATDTEVLLTKKEAAFRLAICIRHLQNLLKARAIEYIKVGKSVRISPDALKRYRDAHTIKAAA